MKFEKLTELIDERITGEWGQEPNSSGVKVIRTTNFTNEGKLDLSNVVERDIEEKKIEKKALIKGDIIIEKSGGGPTQPVGRVVFFDVDSDEKYLCNNFTTILRPKNNLVDSKYLLYQMLYLHKVGKTKKYQNKTTGIHNLNLEKYLQEKVALPSLPDQLHIANLLSKAENLIAQRKESIRLLDEFLKSTFLEMFGNNTANDKGWNKISLVDGCENKKDVKCGPFGTQLSKSEYRESGIPVWGIPQINSEFKILPKEYVTEQKAAELDEYSVVPYDIVMSRKGNVGKCSLFPKGFSKGIIHSDVLRIRTDNKRVHPVFLLFQLKYSKKIEMQIKGVTKGAIMAGINVGLLKHIMIDLPPIELQTKFAQIVEKTEVLKTQYQQSLQELENMYVSLSQRAFRGELTKG